MKRAVIFDYGGVLMQTVDYTPRQRWDQRLGLSPGGVERVVHGSTSWVQVQQGVITLEDYWQDIAQQFNLDDSALRELAHDFYDGDRLDRDLIHYIHELRAADYPVALLSNAPAKLASDLQTLGIVHLFNPLVISAHIGVMKPDPRAFQTVLTQLGRPATETVFVDDMLANVEAATALGIHGIHYQAGMDLRATLQPLIGFPME
ncbi:MAG: HAD family phosphatase [Anaerolineaceae bacterium]|nr:HAD family phosphatase [Anaerolineaceae bacterium]